MPAFRKPAKISYPNHYATQAQIDSAATAQEAQALYLYNCAQRAHGQFMEHYPSVLVAMLVAGVQYPKLAAASGAFWSINRIFFAIGYTSTGEGNKTLGKGRYRGTAYFIPELALYVLVGMAGYNMLMG